MRLRFTEIALSLLVVWTVHCSQVQRSSDTYRLHSSEDVVDVTAPDIVSVEVHTTPDASSVTEALPAGLEELMANNIRPNGRRYAWITGGSHARIVRENPGQTAEAPATPTGFAVVEQSANDVRVETQCGGVRYWVWVATADLTLTPREPTSLSLAPNTPAPALNPRTNAALIVQPGRLLRFGRRQQDVVEVSYRDNDVQFSGWIANSALAPTFVVPERDVNDDTGVESENQEIMGAFDLLDRPSGQVIARVTQSMNGNSPYPRPVRALGRVQSGFRLVEFPSVSSPVVMLAHRTAVVFPGSGSGYQVRGWIRASRVRPSSTGSAYDFGIGTRGVGPLSRSTSAMIAERTVFRSARNGEPVGIASRAQRLNVQPNAEGGWNVSVCSDWGPFTLWVSNVSDVRNVSGAPHTPATPLP